LCYIGASFIDSVTIADKVKVCEAKDLSRLNSSVYSKMPAYSGPAERGFLFLWPEHIRPINTSSTCADTT